MKTYIVITILVLVVFCGFEACDMPQGHCGYTLKQELDIDTPKVSILYRDSILTKIGDKGKDSTRGVYTFDNKGNLRYYAFYVNENQYRFSEEYDSLGNLLRREGTPLIEYRLWKEKGDSVLFNASLVSFNRKYQDLLIVSNKKDTIIPKYLYENQNYSNVKSFAFKLPDTAGIRSLVLYASGVSIDDCTQAKSFFSDTVSFMNTDFSGNLSN